MDGEKMKIGDEVAFHWSDGRPDTVVVITHIGQDGFIDGMDSKGTLYASKNPQKWTKTGRYFQLVTQLLRQMRGEGNDDLISRAEAVEKAKECFDMGDCYCDKPAIIGMLNSLTPAQPELIEKAAYIRGFEQGRMQGMIDSQGGKKFATDAISRHEAIDAMCKLMNSWFGGDPKDEREEIKRIINHLPSAQLATNCSEVPNTSDFVSRKAVSEMVATWSYDMAEWEDVELALHDVDELPPVQPEVIHCKDCKHYRTTGAFGVPLHKEEYFCDAENYPKNDLGEEQRELPEWWFCAGAERKDNKYILDCQTCGLENPSGFKMRDRFTTVPKDVYEKMQMVDLREEQEERLGVAPILYPKAK